MAPSSPDNDLFDPASRRLCPDGACVGVLDDAGRCPVCGQRGTPAPAGSRASVPAFSAQEAAADAANATGEEAAVEPAGGFDSARRLCPDGTCLGVIGPKGVCDVCGRAAS